ncbi:MAG: hypothetical protein LBU83_06560 [Bacteroidales bacterium]|jgi:hypothetical protein|nr:hypothetical protein [Bacteroidales bacterium]
MKKLFIIASLIIILSVFINCTTLVRTPISNFRSNRSKYYHGYVYDRFKGKRKPIQSIRIYPEYCPPELCTEAEIAGKMTDENGYFKIRRPNIPVLQLLVVEFEGKEIGRVHTITSPRPGVFEHRLFRDRKRADTIIVDIERKDIGLSIDVRRFPWW